MLRIVISVVKLMGTTLWSPADEDGSSGRRNGQGTVGIGEAPTETARGAVLGDLLACEGTQWRN